MNSLSKPCPTDLMNRYIMLDVESNGPLCGHHSMVSYGLVCVGDLDISHYKEIAPVSENYIPEALAVSGFSFEQTQSFQPPEDAIAETIQWLEDVRRKLGGKPLILWADNPGYDFGWMNYYFLRYGGTNPFGHSCRSVPEFWCGLRDNIRDRAGWKKYKRTAHSHNALDDAMGNAEALRHLLGHPYQP